MALALLERDNMRTEEMALENGGKGDSRPGYSGPSDPVLRQQISWIH